MIPSLMSFFLLQSYLTEKKPAFQLAEFVAKRGFEIVTGKGFVPIIQNDEIIWLALQEGETLDQRAVACMYSSSLHFNLIMSTFSPTSHILVKLNFYPHRNLTHACHMISVRWNFILREWEIANNDGLWTSTRRVDVDGQEQDGIFTLMHNFEETESITLYHFYQVKEPVRKLINSISYLNS